jgi:hypothetical protein
MPRKPNPELKKLALQLFAQGYSAPQTLDKLEEEARNSIRKKLEPKFSGDELEKKVGEELGRWHLPTCVDTLYGWKKEASKKLDETRKQFIETVESLPQTSAEPEGIIDKLRQSRSKQKASKADEKHVTEGPPADTMETPSPRAPMDTKSEQKAFPDEPSLSDFTSRHVPREIALQLLETWDAARHDGDAFYMNFVRNIVALYSEFPKIPPEYAESLAQLQAQGEEFQVKDALELAKLAKRYRPWENKDNSKSFMDVASYLGLWTPLDPAKRNELEKRLLSWPK